MDDEQKAFEELKILKEIIFLQEEARAKIKSWAVGLVSAITVTFVSERISLSWEEYLLICGGILALFLWMDVIHRVAEDRAIKRSSEIEVILRDRSKQYDGPKISISVSIPNKFSEQRKALLNVRVYSPYAVIMALIIIVAVVHTYVR
jgi:hypothetical protein